MPRISNYHGKCEHREETSPLLTHDKILISRKYNFLKKN